MARRPRKWGERAERRQVAMEDGRHRKGSRKHRRFCREERQVEFAKRSSGRRRCAFACANRKVECRHRREARARRRCHRRETRARRRCHRRKGYPGGADTGVYGLGGRDDCAAPSLRQVWWRGKGVTGAAFRGRKNRG